MREELVAIIRNYTEGDYLFFHDSEDSFYGKIGMIKIYDAIAVVVFLESYRLCEKNWKEILNKPMPIALDSPSMYSLNEKILTINDRDKYYNFYHVDNRVYVDTARFLKKVPNKILPRRVSV